MNKQRILLINIKLFQFHIKKRKKKKTIQTYKIKLKHIAKKVLL